MNGKLKFPFLFSHQEISSGSSYIKLSSPKLNNVMVIGAMHIHISILLFALDEWCLERNLFGHGCMVNSIFTLLFISCLISYGFFYSPVDSH